MSTLVTAIRELRERTGAGMMDCRIALETSGGAMNRAIAFLRERGVLEARRRESREAKEGRVFLRADHRKALLLRVACETDFVARNADFVRLGESWLSVAFESSATEEELMALIRRDAAKFHEKVVLQNLKALSADENERLFTYLHGEGRIGSVVRLKSSAAASSSSPDVWNSPDVRKLAGDLTLHVAAFSPLFLTLESVDREYRRQKEAEFLADATAIGKPADMLHAIVSGKVVKHLSRICLLEQAFIREETATVGEVVGRLSGSGTDIHVTGFLYDRVGS